MSPERLRNLPAVDEILRHAALDGMTQVFPRQQIVEWIRIAVHRCRQQILEGLSASEADVEQIVIAETQHQAALEDGSRQQPVINATGILLHTNLGRSPLADRAVQRMQQSSGFANVELNLQTGRRSQRADRVCRLLSRLTGAEDAVIVNNCAAATMLVLQTMAAGREVIVSRGQLVEIGGGFRLPEVFAASGAGLREVGTTNRTYLRDYEAAISENTGAIIRVHRSNFFQAGFVTEPDIADLVMLGREHGIPVVDDVGSGCIEDLTDLGLKEPIVADSVAAGADLTLFSGDKLFGGPQAGIIVGNAAWVEKVGRNPMMRALRMDKTTLAAIEATTEIHLAGTARQELPLLQMLNADADQIRERCEQVLDTIDVASDGVFVDVEECTSQVGGGSVPGSQIPSFGLRIQAGHVNRIAHRLRCGNPAVLARVHDDCLMLDLRSVLPAQLNSLADGISAALEEASEDEV